MPNRPQVQTACQSCRKKRTKCDGRVPCRRCEEIGEACEYSRNRHVSKDELRAEIAQLKRALNLSQASAEGNEPRRDSMEGLYEDPGSSSAFPSQASFSQGTSRTESTGPSSTQPAVDPPCFDQLLSWRTCRAGFDDSHEGPQPSTVLSLPPLPLDAYASQPRTDIWTDTGWTAAHIRHLFDVLLTWDYLPFCLLSKDMFLQDYYSGSDRMCSSALVHAILALATSMVNEHGDSDEVLPTGWLGSRIFCEKAEAIVRDNKQTSSIPDAQALGVLALYHLRCGREAEALEAAESFVTIITKLCKYAPLTSIEDQQYTRVRAATYCSAVSLTRMLSMATGRLFNPPGYAGQEDPFFYDQLYLSSDTASQAGDILTPNLGPGVYESTLCNSQLIAAEMFRLTDLVHGLVVAPALSPTRRPSSYVVTIYRKCLDLYERLFRLFNAEGSRTPFVLFIHMYYHFCLLCAFRRFVSLPMEDSDVRPHEICTQSAQSILALAQSYDDLFTLRRVSALIPYFVCTSGLFCLAVEDSGAHMDPAHLRRGQEREPPGAAEPEPKRRRGSRFGSSFSSRVTMSAAAHARLLLAKMGSTHPAAAVAHRKLQEEIGSAS